MRSTPIRTLRLVAALLALLGASSCASWQQARTGEHWKLYVRDGSAVDLDGFEDVLAPAFAAVEERMGPFERSVRIHAWNGSVDLESGNGGVLEEGADGQLHEVPGIGPARVRAFHVRGGSSLFAPSGVFLGTPDVGTAVHELVHARLAERHDEVPLWFEEGLASLFGDGAMYDDAWQVDGLACWPMRELREQELGDEELARLLSISARDEYDARENLLVHFVGWAIVFDLYREDPDGSWTDWLETYERGAKVRGELREARGRLARTLERRTHEEWLGRLRHSDPAVRLAAAKGIWKLRSKGAIDLVLDALETEEDPEVRAGLAINALLTTGDTRLGSSRWRRLSRLVFPTLRETQVPDATEQDAMEDLYASMRWGSRRRGTVREAIEGLTRYWEE